MVQKLVNTFASAEAKSATTKTRFLNLAENTYANNTYGKGTLFCHLFAPLRSKVKRGAVVKEDSVF